MQCHDWEELLTPNTGPKGLCVWVWVVGGGGGVRGKPSHLLLHASACHHTPSTVDLMKLDGLQKGTFSSDLHDGAQAASPCKASFGKLFVVYTERQRLQQAWA